MEVRTGLAVGAALGIVAGILGGRVWDVFATEPPEFVVANLEERNAPASPGRSSAQLAESDPGSARSLEDIAPEPDETGSSMREAATGDTLIGPALSKYAEDEIAAGWDELRTDPISEERARTGFGEFEGLVHSGPRAIGRRLAEFQTQREVAEGRLVTDDPIKFLKAIAEPGVGPVVAIVRDPAKFGELFRRQHKVGLIDGSRLGNQPDDAIVDGSVVRFPAGAFRVDHLMRSNNPFPSEVTLQGAGMNATLLVIPGLYTRFALRTFAIRDCTVFTNNNYLFDLRLQPATMDFERVRFIGFDMGAGSSCLFGTKETALRMADCVVEGGYGRHPQSGRLMRIETDGLVGRFDRCEFKRMNMGINLAASGATLVFSQCKLQDVFGDPVADAEQRPGVYFDDCLVIPYEGKHGDIPRLDLNDLFPGWEAAIGRR